MHGIWNIQACSGCLICSAIPLSSTMAVLRREGNPAQPLRRVVASCEMCQASCERAPLSTEQPLHRVEQVLILLVGLQAQKALEEKLEGDAFLQGRVEKVTVGAHQKNVYSVHRWTVLSHPHCLLSQKCLLD